MFDFMGDKITKVLNFPFYQKNCKITNKAKKSFKGFSVAEAMVALAIGGVVLGMSAPLITKQVNNASLNDAQMQFLQRQIDALRANQTGAPVGAVMFFNLSKCPPGWTPLLPKSDDEKLSSTENPDYKLRGYYPRIAAEDDKDIGYTKQEMVHRHKHISPFMQAISYDANANDQRYGPFRNSDNEGGLIYGDAEYKKISLLKKNSKYSPSDTSSVLFTAVSTQYDNNNWYSFTSDGMNRVEKLRTASGGVTSILTCPNKDEADEEGKTICKEGDNSFEFEGDGYSMKVTNIPLLTNMPLVGDENRPNSIMLLACQRTSD